jgi:hypothetical protein
LAVNIWLLFENIIVRIFFFESFTNQNRREKVKNCLRLLTDARSFLSQNFGVPLPFRLLLVELLQLTNNIGQLALTNRFLGGKYLLHGMTTFSSIWGETRKGQRFFNFVVISFQGTTIRKKSMLFAPFIRSCFIPTLFQLTYP